MKRVLVVEDSEFIANAIRLVLESQDIVVDNMSDGSKVVEYVKSKGINLVILDLMMPGISGKDVFKMLKQDPKTKSVPVLILTAKTDALKWDEELKCCDKFMKKPFDNKELLSEVKKLLKC